MTPAREKPARELLDFYLEAGADALVGEAPVDRIAAAEVTLPPSERDRPAQAAQVAVNPQPRDPTRSVLRTDHPPLAGEGKTMVAPDEAAMAAREAAKSAQTLDELRAILDKFDGCALKATATRLVFADGNPQAKLMLVGEAPGRDEDIEGLPFVGRSGKLLDRMLAAIGLDRTSVYIANIVPWRPPGNRDPSPHEIAICLPFILRQIELVDPDILVCLGKPSTHTLLATTEAISKIRGRWFTFNTGKRDIRAMPTFHPAFLLRGPLQKRFAWRDFLSVKKALGGIVAAIFMLAAAWPIGNAHGQPAASEPPSEPATSEPALLDPNLLKIPQPEPRYDNNKFDLGKFEKDKFELAIPSISFGSTMLRFDTDRSVLNTAPRTGIGSADPALLNLGTPARKEQPLKPNYFGLTITTPIR